MTILSHLYHDDFRLFTATCKCDFSLEDKKDFKLNDILPSCDYGKDLLLFPNPRFYLTPSSIL